MEKQDANQAARMIRSLMRDQKYREVVRLAQNLDLDSIKNGRLILDIVEAYSRLDDSVSARDILYHYYQRRGISGEMMMRKLISLCMETGDTNKAVQLCMDYEKKWPEDSISSLMRYQIASAAGGSLEERITYLKDYNKKRFEERWGYELARLYEKNHQITECSAICHELICFFGYGPYVERAAELKRRIDGLTEDEKNILEAGKEREAQAKQQKEQERLRAEEEAKQQKELRRHQEKLRQEEERQRREKEEELYRLQEAYRQKEEALLRQKREDGYLSAGEAEADSFYRKTQEAGWDKIRQTEEQARRLREKREASRTMMENRVDNALKNDSYYDRLEESGENRIYLNDIFHSSSEAEPVAAFQEEAPGEKKPSPFGKLTSSLKKTLQTGEEDLIEEDDNEEIEYITVGRDSEAYVRDIKERILSELNLLDGDQQEKLTDSQIKELYELQILHDVRDEIRDLLAETNAAGQTQVSEAEMERFTQTDPYRNPLDSEAESEFAEEIPASSIEEEKVSGKEENALVEEEETSAGEENALAEEEETSVEEENALIEEEETSAEEENALVEEEEETSAGEENALVEEEETSAEEENAFIEEKMEVVEEIPDLPVREEIPESSVEEKAEAEEKSEPPVKEEAEILPEEEETSREPEPAEIEPIKPDEEPEYAELEKKPEAVESDKETEPAKSAETEPAKSAETEPVKPEDKPEPAELEKEAESAKPEEKSVQTILDRISNPEKVLTLDEFTKCIEAFANRKGYQVDPSAYVTIAVLAEEIQQEGGSLSLVTARKMAENAMERIQKRNPFDKLIDRYSKKRAYKLKDRHFYWKTERKEEMEEKEPLDIKMIALDMDGTLLLPDKSLSQENKQVLTRAAKQGIQVVLSTGRPSTAVTETAEQLPFVRYVVLSNGAVVKDLETDQIIAEYMMSTKEALRLYDYAKEHQVMVDFFTDGDRIVSAEWKKALDNMEITQGTRQMLLANCREVENPRAYLEKLPGVEKMNLRFPNEEARNALYGKVEKEFPGLNICSSLNTNIEANKKGVSKALGLEALSKHLGLEMKSVMAFGDSCNDLEMLQEAGIGVAMGNAEEETKKAADRVTKANTEDGVAYMIKEVLGW